MELENFFLRVGRPRRGTRYVGSPEMEAVRTFGGKLFDTVFQGRVQSCLFSSLHAVRQQGQVLRLRLHLNDASALADLPWEYLYDANLDRFFANSTATPLVRHLDLSQPPAPLTVQPPLKVLVMIASPRDREPLDVEQEWRNMQRALGDLEARGLVQLTRLQQATLGALQRQLRREQYHIFHFIGHGGFDRQSDSGVLLLEDENGLSLLVSGYRLGALLHDHFALRLALLNSCEGARNSRRDPFAGVGQHLVQQGIPAVIAMQFEITDAAAITLAHEFYAALADNYGVDAALTEARKAIFASGNDIEWGTPVLYLRAQDGNIFDISAAPPTNAQDHVKSVPISLSTPQPAPAKPLRWRQPGLWLVACVLLMLVIGWTLQPRFARWLAALQGDGVPPVVTKTTTFAPDNTAGVVITTTATLTATDATTDVALIPTFTAITLLTTTPVPTATLTQPPPPTATETPAPTLIFTDTLLPPLTNTTTAPPTPTPTLVPGAPLTVTVTGINFNFVYVPTGEFMMGSPDGTGKSNEHPPSQVSLPAFWIGQTKVTNAQYRPFFDAGGYQQDQWWTQTGLAWRDKNEVEKPSCWADTPGDQENYPVICVSWYEVYAYAGWLADATMLPIRLPTEAQWERAARGDDGRIYPWGNEPPTDKLLNYNGNLGHTTVVGSYPDGKSPYGALDMAGNVWEWTNSRYLDYPYQNDDAHENAEGDAGRVLRGGSWYYGDSIVRAADRSRSVPGNRNHVVGVRLVVGAPQ